MRTALLAALLLSGCSQSNNGPPYYQGRGAIHEIVAYYPGNRWTLGTCFAIDDHHLYTASHCVIDPITGENPYSIIVEGVEVSVLVVGVGDNTPAVVESPLTFSITLPTATSNVNSPGRMESIYRTDYGTIEPKTHTISGFIAIQGESGSPVIDDTGTAVGVFVGTGGPGVNYWEEF